MAIYAVLKKASKGIDILPLDLQSSKQRVRAIHPGIMFDRIYLEGWTDFVTADRFDFYEHNKRIDITEDKRFNFRPPYVDEEAKV